MWICGCGHKLLLLYSSRNNECQLKPRIKNKSLKSLLLPNFSTMQLYCHVKSQFGGAGGDVLLKGHELR